MNTRNTGLLRTPIETRRLPLRLGLAALLLLTTLASPVSHAQAPNGDELPERLPGAETVVHIAEVTIESAEDLAKLRRLGYANADGAVCEIEATDAQLRSVREAGLVVTVVGIAVRGSSKAAALEPYVEGHNSTDIWIPNPGSNWSAITISGAPSVAKVTRVQYSCRVYQPDANYVFTTNNPADYVLTVRPASMSTGAKIWNRLGGSTDQGYDDDPADDRDIDLWGRWIPTTFDGQPVNQNWYLEAVDQVSTLPILGGRISYFDLYIYYCTGGPSAPSLVAPAHLGHICDTTPSFDWTDVSLAKQYWIEVDDLPTFTSPEIDRGTATSAFTAISPLGPGRWYWRVRGRSECGWGAWSGMQRFTIDASAVPAVPSNPSPSHTATGVALGAGLHWDSAAGATTYEVYFGTTTPPPLVATVSSTHYDLPALTASTQYYWKIVAVSSCGRTHGPVWRFTTGEHIPLPENTPTPTRGPSGAYRVYLPIVLKRSPGVLSITLEQNNIERGLFLDSGGDVDTEVVLAGSPAVEARRTGNGQALTSADGNQIGDSYLQVNVDDSHVYAGSPTTRVRIEIKYLDQGSDTLSMQYDALSGGPFSDGRFKDAGAVSKTNCGEFRTAVFTLNDAYFADRGNGADFRISDNGDGAETIRRVTVTLLFP